MIIATGLRSRKSCRAKSRARQDEMSVPFAGSRAR
jgi:hypothetical protein